MLELVSIVDSVGLTDRIDELSIRLTLDGVATLGSADFERLSGTARDSESAAVADGARRIARDIAAVCKTIFPALRTRSRIHIWNAAYSSGEEAYSIAMSLLEESPREAAAKVRIKATDISTRFLDKATHGVYPAERFDGIPVTVLQRYLLKGQNESAVIGHSESLNNISHGLDYVCPATHRKSGHAGYRQIGRG